ncbi:hypothetical protein [Streptomyces sp. NRRL B-24484]|uniref:hypothetical protein n=1 Tax=Streptomyces sp. NRRL B-24484 TaxID=1463833 RepID=UPI0004C20AD3|nr:hypothetical protein [Streptomyces sp. NRRL B-24484]
MDFPPELLVEALTLEAELQSKLKDAADLTSRRNRLLYEAWQRVKDSRAVAAHMPRTVNKKTVEKAVREFAPPVGWDVLELDLEITVISS